MCSFPTSKLLLRLATSRFRIVGGSDINQMQNCYCWLFTSYFVVTFIPNFWRARSRLCRSRCCKLVPVFILQDVFRSTRFSHFCTSLISQILQILFELVVLFLQNVVDSAMYVFLLILKNVFEFLEIIVVRI